MKQRAEEDNYDRNGRGTVGGWGWGECCGAGAGTGGWVG